jgi:hypothetical protein
MTTATSRSTLKKSRTDRIGCGSKSQGLLPVQLVGAQFVGGTSVSIVRVGLSENKDYAEGFQAIFGKKKAPTAKKKTTAKASAAASAKKKKTGKKK